MKVYVEKRLNKDKKAYYVMYIDFGYAELPLTFKLAEMAEFADVRVSELAQVEVGDKLHVADYVLVK